MMSSTSRSTNSQKQNEITSYSNVTPDKNRRLSRKLAYEQQGLLSPSSPPPSLQQPSIQQDIKEPKLIYLIRHGESMGQRATRKARESDPSLIDCGLSPTGIQQAKLLHETLNGAVDLVVCSPLTRALETALLVFSSVEILCHYHLREIGSRYTENCPRPMSQVLQDLEKKDYDISQVNVTMLQPQNWPEHHDVSPSIIRRRDHIPSVLKWLAMARPERVIAIVCHYHVIRAALSRSDGSLDESIQPRNCLPIACHLCPQTGCLKLLKDD